ncbi:tetratricopeptide repeat protein, partial [Geitlerinema sp. PCC 9228]|uniref:tetratricopeptide repeat protein n=1 Tax=Geitlerinema sp. PCC 9228 TaxID=111611 RepID=UPI00147C364A
IDPNHANNYNILGNAYSDQGKYEQAIAAYQQAIQLNPDVFSPYENFGIVRSLQGNISEAQELWRKSLELCPGNTPKEKLDQLVIRIALEDVTDIATETQTIVEQLQSAKGVLKGAKDDLELLAKSPQPPQGVEIALDILKNATAE